MSLADASATRKSSRTYLAEREAKAERIRQEAEAVPANKALREKLLARRR